MRKRAAEGVYTEWDTLQEDMRTMFTNAMTFNPFETLYHKQVCSLASEEAKKRGAHDREARGPSEGCETLKWRHELHACTPSFCQEGSSSSNGDTSFLHRRQRRC